MTASSRTWFYSEPEHRPYLIEERVNGNLWATRFGSIYLDCVHAEPPFAMEGKWNGIDIRIEWLPNNWFTMRTSREDKTLVTGFAQALQLLPVVSYTETDGTVVTEWHRDPAMMANRLRDIQSSTHYTNVKTYKR
jgi:hypothetical protein